MIEQVARDGGGRGMITFVEVCRFNEKAGSSMYPDNRSLSLMSDYEMITMSR